jgi:two-component system, NtrC family, response regulator AtoC
MEASTRAMVEVGSAATAPAVAGLREPSRHGWADQVTRLHERREAAQALSVPADALLDSSGMADVLTSARRMAGVAGTPVLVEGERGTGLREIARFIHEEDLSSRNAQFRALAAQFVGDPRSGKARSGTLYIEDVEQLTPAGQEWLMSALTEGAGADRRVRIVAGSQLSASELLSHHQLSHELVLMLDVGRLALPPLRARPTDIMELARRFLAHCANAQGRPSLRFSSEATIALRAHSYPGNVRELRNVVERAVALEPSHEITRQSIVFHEDLHEHARHRGCAEATARQLALADGDRRRRALPTLAEMEREYMLMLVRELRGRRTAISRVMGVSYPTVLKKLAAHGLDVRAILADEAPSTPDV